MCMVFIGAADAGERYVEHRVLAVAQAGWPARCRLRLAVVVHDRDLEGLGVVGSSGETKTVSSTADRKSAVHVASIGGEARDPLPEPLPRHGDLIFEQFSKNGLMKHLAVDLRLLGDQVQRVALDNRVVLNPTRVRHKRGLALTDEG